MGLSNYPPGHPTGWSHEEWDWQCVNESCENYKEVVAVAMTIDRETNSAEAANEDDCFCDKCHKEMEVV